MEKGERGRMGKTGCKDEGRDEVDESMHAEKEGIYG